MRRLARVLLAAVLCVGCGWAPSRALAHAALIEAEPADGAMLASAPSHARLRFNEPVSPISVRLIDAAGISRDDVAFTAHDDLIDISLPHDLPTGTQSLSYRIISADGHPVGGVVAFSIGAPTAPMRAAATSDAVRSFGLWVSGAMAYATLLAGVGGVFFVTFVAPAGAAGGVSGPLVVLLATALAALAGQAGFQGLDVLDRPAGDLLRGDVWRAGLSNGFGIALALQFNAIVAALAALKCWPGGARRGLSFLAMAALGAGLASTGHASTAPPVWLARPAVFVHVVCAAVWVGALAPLATLAHQRSSALNVALSRFSGLALWTVPALIAAGLTLAGLQTTAVRDLLTTDYGRILSAKLVGVVLLLGLAAANFALLSPRVRRGDDRSRRALAGTIAGEMVLALAILSLVAGWRLTPPPRALIPPVETIHIHGEKMMAMLTLSPGRVGANRIHIDLMDGNFGPMTPADVALSMAPADQSLEPRAYQARPSPDGGFDIENALANVAGPWRLEIAARIDDFTEYRLSDTRDFEK